MKLGYTNKKGNFVELILSEHAKKRFVERWKKLNNEPINNVEEEIINRFNSSNLVQNLSNKDKTRLKRYGKDTLYFRTFGFTFVVQNCIIKTIEISDKGKRHLN